MRASLLFILASLSVTSCSPQEKVASPSVAFDKSSITNVWHQAKLRGVSFRAIGQEPGWLLEITTGTEIFLSTDYGQSKIHYQYTDPEVDVEDHRTLYITGDGDVEILIQGKDCKDTMSGEHFSVTVTVTIKEKKLAGCGRALH
jgi:putative lipoprotein